MFAFGMWDVARERLVLAATAECQATREHTDDVDAVRELLRDIMTRRMTADVLVHDADVVAAPDFLWLTVRDVECLFWREIVKGLSSEDAAVAVGVSQVVGGRWFRQRGGTPLFMVPQSWAGICRSRSGKRSPC
jgi:hypothetical protein